MRGYNNLSDDEIVEVVREYLKDSIYNYAILIDGDWGIGKSYFIKKYLIPKIEKDYRKVEITSKKIFVYLNKIIKKFNKKTVKRIKNLYIYHYMVLTQQKKFQGKYILVYLIKKL